MKTNITLEEFEKKLTDMAERIREMREMGIEISPAGQIIVPPIVQSALGAAHDHKHGPGTSAKAQVDDEVAFLNENLANPETHGVEAVETLKAARTEVIDKLELLLVLRCVTGAPGFTDELNMSIYSALYRLTERKKVVTVKDAKRWINQAAAVFPSWSRQHTFCCENLPRNIGWERLKKIRARLSLVLNEELPML